MVHISSINPSIKSSHFLFQIFENPAGNKQTTFYILKFEECVNTHTHTHTHTKFKFVKFTFYVFHKIFQHHCQKLENLGFRLIDFKIIYASFFKFCCEKRQNMFSKSVQKCRKSLLLNFPFAI